MHACIGLPLPEPDNCKLLKKGETCPMKKDQSYVVTISLPLSSDFPHVSRILHMFYVHFCWSNFRLRWLPSCHFMMRIRLKLVVFRCCCGSSKTGAMPNYEVFIWPLLIPIYVV